MELVRWFTVDRAGPSEEFSAVKCMPNAFPLALAATNHLYGLFSQRFITSSYGGISDFICEFVEDENGVCYFLKLADYCKEQKKEYQKEWKTT